MKKSLLFAFIIALLSFSLFYITSCNEIKVIIQNGENSFNSLSENDLNLLEKESFLNYAILEGIYNKSIVLAVVGDIMVHSPQLTSAYLENEGAYHFKDCFSYITSYLHKADFAAGNLETTIAGREFGYSGYPFFNSPPELITALRESGFHLLFTANNHSMDRGEKGVINTINYLEEECSGFVGTARNQEERERGFMLSQNGIKVAFFAYTYGTNGIPLPSGKEYLVSLIDEQLIEEDIIRAKQIQEADLVVVALHWGEEYQRLPSSYQKELARKLVDMGADIIIGGHPHVIQPAEIIKTEKGEGLCLYSLGNFISNQRWRYSDSGVIVYLKLQLNPALNTSQVTLLEIIPTWVHKFLQEGKWKYTVLPVREVLETENAKEIYKLSNRDYQRLQEVQEETEEIFWRFWYN
ncbi:MAG: CapA family protein [Dethiobacter sp.]|jgi:poly-gamma-glutamate synthesis protein (capsule biosynthesis protein)|nr:MAG: CapA family protein [Dethiobacter sp.]